MRNARLKKLALPLAALALAALFLWLPFPALSALDARLTTTAAQQDPDILSTAGRQCDAARQLYCQRQSWQYASGYQYYNPFDSYEATDDADGFNAALGKALQALSAQGIMTAAMSDAAREAAASANYFSCSTGTPNTEVWTCHRQTETTLEDGTVSTAIEDNIEITLVNGSIVTGFQWEGAPTDKVTPQTAAERYATYLGKAVLNDWRTVDLTLYTESTALYSADGQLYLCVMRDTDNHYLSISAGSMTGDEIASIEANNAKRTAG